MGSTVLVLGSRPVGEECYLVHTQSAGNTPLYKTEIIELLSGC